ncbi:uncharacterized protein LOC114940942 isoform X2 [Nylanderia fulva]|uniref:uncharacterized protein LOC114940942 isoform X2 n=1 Tax=Nylanderia fulva TaxID=613905 RepID=UPI0010FB46CE|nr:uncharacterized protein LOC114940942 isoform X2 [Nylanderia fulva]XP_029171591.1 uncharacterized protein LOC114940942 isoform X2 [Nylanderia fulva]XP_029171592.1 uncharacterized protein LOC114940942 isoform X2 [Nylanderia fulva]
MARKYLLGEVLEFDSGCLITGAGVNALGWFPLPLLRERRNRLLRSSCFCIFETCNAQFALLLPSASSRLVPYQLSLLTAGDLMCRRLQVLLEQLLVIAQRTESE